MEAAAKAIAVSATLSLLSSTFVVLRSVSRFGILKRADVDDILIIFGALFSLTLTALIIIQAHFGLGQHYKTVSPSEYENMLKPFWASIPLYNLGLTTTKLSVLFQFLRFFITTKTRWTTWFLISVVSSYGLAVLIVSICSCQPVSFFWDKSIKNGVCINLLAFWYANAAFNIITDIAVVVLPICVFHKLNLPKRQRLVLIGIFALGGFTCLTSILRLHSIYVVARSADVTWDNADAAMWSAIELNTAIICACMPAMKPVVKAVAPDWLTWSTNRSTAPTNDSIQDQTAKMDRRQYLRQLSDNQEP